MGSFDQNGIIFFDNIPDFSQEVLFGFKVKYGTALCTGFCTLVCVVGKFSDTADHINADLGSMCAGIVVKFILLITKLIHIAHYSYGSSCCGRKYIQRRFHGNRISVVAIIDDQKRSCDNGIAAAEEIAYAKSMGMTIVVTDHHEVPYTEIGTGRRYILPEADAVVDPKQEDCTYPFKGLCGAAVAYKLVEALMEAMGKDAEDADYLMENVAIATIGDVMDLVDENRIFVKQGLDMLKRTENLGLKALMGCTGVNVDKLSPYHIGFVIGPCMNASGRLDTAKRALELLEAKKVAEADLLAGDLKALNDSRKDMTAQAVEEAFIQVENSELKDADVLVVYLPECHESLAGIVAGRIREKYYRPVFVLTKGAEGLKGSGRSIETWHMYEGLNRVKHLLSKFGGHKMAAGLSMPEENLEQFRKEINEKSGITPEDLNEKIAIDMQLPFECVNEKFIGELAVLEPFGKGNARPVFAERQVQVESARILGKNKNVLKLQVKDLHGTRMDAMYFGDVNTFVEYVREKFGDIACECLLRGHGHGIVMAFTYYPDINEYQGVRKPQIVIQNYK